MSRKHVVSLSGDPLPSAARLRHTAAQPGTRSMRDVRSTRDVYGLHTVASVAGLCAMYQRALSMLRAPHVIVCILNERRV